LNGDYSDSFENIIKATSLNTLKPEIWYNLGILYEKCKQPEEALIAYSKVQDLNIGDPDSIQRINDIQSPFYNQNQGIFNLEMKQPSFNLPNSLTILNKYKKQQQKPDDANPSQAASKQNQGSNAQDQNGQNSANNFAKPQGGDQIHLSR
tara:strand:+ start:514 stop:963 length:450 start_codon:yes stop_codon:yes gene_type:complete